MPKYLVNLKVRTHAQKGVSEYIYIMKYKAPEVWIGIHHLGRCSKNKRYHMLSRCTSVLDQFCGKYIGFLTIDIYIYIYIYIYLHIHIQYTEMAFKSLKVSFCPTIPHRKRNIFYHGLVIFHLNAMLLDLWWCKVTYVWECCIYIGLRCFSCTYRK